MSSDSYKLHYFDGRGLAEISRLLFVAADVKFTDERLPVEEDRKTWLAMKPSTPFGKIPLLEVNGVAIPQSKAIERFLANRFGFFGAGEIEAAKIDAVVEELRDVQTGWFPVRADAEKAKAFYDGDMKTSFMNLNKYAQSNGFFVGNKISYADIAFSYFVSTVLPKDVSDKALEGLDNLKKIVATFNANERIAKYTAARKVTPW